MKLTQLALAGAAMLFAAGCTGMRMKVKTPSGAVMPVDCIDKIVAASANSTCRMLPEPRLFKCVGEFWVEAHCWKVKSK